MTALKPYLHAGPEIRIYECAERDSIRCDLGGIALEIRLDPSSRCPTDGCLLDRMRRWNQHRFDSSARGTSGTPR